MRQGCSRAELFDMYRKYAGLRGWRFEVLEYDESELGGLKGASAESTAPTCSPG